VNPSSAPGGGSRWLIAALVLVVAGAIVMLLVTRPAKSPDVSQASALPAVAGQVLVGPDARFTWARDRRADVYRLEVYDLRFHLLGAAVCRDTSVPAAAILPDSAHAGVWRVVPVSVGGTELPATRNLGFIRR